MQQHPLNAHGPDATSRSSAALVAALAAGPALAAEEAHRLVVPLSNPSKPADLDVALVLGSIRVAAGKAGEVVIEAQRDDDDDDDDDD